MAGFDHVYAEHLGDECARMYFFCGDLAVSQHQAANQQCGSILNFGMNTKKG